MIAYKWLTFMFAILIGIVPAYGYEALQQKKIHDLYNEGDFDGVIGQIARFCQANPRHSRDDSVFIAKHLAVVYAANPKSVGQGKYWMNELLKLMPAADLVGMYVSDEIDRVFENVRKEFLARQHSFGVDTAQVALPGRPKEVEAEPDQTVPATAAPTAPRPTDIQGAGISPIPSEPRPAQAKPADPVSAPNPRMGGEKRFALKRSYWILGGSALGATAVGLTTYLILSSSRAPAPDKEITIPRNPQIQ